MKNLFLIFLYILSNRFVIAQEVEWVNQIGGMGDQVYNSSGTDGQGNVYSVVHSKKPIIVNGTTINSQNPNWKYTGYLIKYDSEGKIIWAKQFGQFSINRIAVNKAGEVAFWGMITNINSSFIDSVTYKAPTKYGAFVIGKIDANGNTVWKKLINTRYMGSINILESGYVNLYRCSHWQTVTVINGVSFNGNEFHICRFDSLGSFIKVNKLQWTLVNKIYPYNMVTSEDGSIYFSGQFNQDINFGGGNNLVQIGSKDRNVFVVKFDSAQNFIWANSVYTNNIYNGFSGSSEYSVGLYDKGKVFLSVSFIGGVIHFGKTITDSTSGKAFRHAVMAMLDDSGRFVWGKVDKTSSPSANPNIYVSSFAKAFQGELYATVNYKSDTLSYIKFLGLDFQSSKSNVDQYSIIKIDSNGNGTLVKDIRQLSFPFFDVDGSSIYLNLFTKDTFSIDSLNFKTTDSIDSYIIKINVNQIFKGTISPATYCAGDSIYIPFTKTGFYHSTSVFIAELSDSSGGFAKPTELGSVSDTTSTMIRGRMPLTGLPSNKNYKVRIRSINPGLTSDYKKDTISFTYFSRDTANAGPDIHLCYNQNKVLKTTGGTRWVWTDSLTGDTIGLNWNCSISKPSTYRVIISDSTGCGPTDTDYVEVKMDTIPVIVIDTIVKVCKQTNKQLKAHGIGGCGKYSFNWFDPFGKIVSTTDSLSFNTLNGNYYISIVMIDSCSGYRDSQSIYIVVDSLGILTKNSTICAGDSILMEADLGLSYLWSTGHTSKSFWTRPQSDSIYTLSITDAMGCVYQSNKKLFINSPANPVFNSNIFVSCGSKKFTLSDTSGLDSLIAERLWIIYNSNWDTSIKSSQNSIDINLHDTGSYHVKLIQITKQGCIDSLEKLNYIFIYPIPNPIINAPQTICYNDSIKLSAGKYSKYLWSTNDTGEYIYVKNTGDYFVQVYNQYNCSAISDTLHTDLLPQFSVTIVNKNDTLTALSSRESKSWLWLIDGNSFVGNTQKEIVAPQNGNYTVEVIDSNGCKATSQTYIFYNGFVSPNSLKTNATIFPNPAQSDIHVLLSMDHQGNALLVIYDITGKEIYTQQLNQNQTVIPVKSFSEGVYILKSVINNKVGYMKFIIER